MLQKISLLLCVLCTLVLVGCAKSEPPTNGASPSTASANRATSSTAPASSSAGEKIGVPECDEFLSAYEACVSGKVPEAARAQYKSGIEQWRSSWRKLAGDPNTRASLAAACKQSAEAARASMKTYGCTF
jgi:hypothetical protein